MPVLTPPELWEATGRISIPEIFHLEDRTRTEVHPPDDARGDRDLPRARDPELPAAAADALPLRDQGSRRAAAARRAAPRPRVHHEGRLLVRSRRRGPRRQLPQAGGRVPPHVRALRARVLGGRGRVGDHGRQGVDRLPRAVRLGREHARDVRERRLRGRSRDRPRNPSRRCPARSTRCSREGRDARRHHDRGAGGVRRRRQLGDLEGHARGQVRRHPRPRPRTRRRPPLGVEDARRARLRLPAGDRRGDQGGVRRERRLARPGRSRRRDRRGRRAARRAVRGGSEPRRLASPRRRGGAGLLADVRGHPRAGRGRHVPRVRRRAALPDGDRGRAHLQVRRSLLDAARRPRSSTRTGPRSR